MSEAIRILVWAKGARRRIALLDEGKLAEFYLEERDDTSLVNAVILGRVERVVPGMHAAFVQLGQSLNGYLPLSEKEDFQRSGEDKPLSAGAELIVQVKKDARDQKGAFLTRDISLPGQYLILMPLNRYVGVSKRVADDDERAALMALGHELSGNAYGLVMRSAALPARPDALVQERDSLLALWTAIRERAVYAKAPAVLQRDLSVLSALVRDYAPRYEITITCNDAVNRMPSPPTGLLWEQVGEPEMEALWKSSRVAAQLQEALGRRVELRNGGSLVIDEREALTTVDVNSGKFIPAASDDLPLKLNLAACPEIARQLRLREASGIVLIDFIDMKNDEQRAQVALRMKEELSRERDKTVVHGFTSLGLLEMTRKRAGASLRERIARPCETCGGTGYRLERESVT
ncbi:MAG: hypothetical protein GX418_06215 [Clostridiales bacterium]|nr:hypothetical protein [Clostridiales bacterium]